MKWFTTKPKKVNPPAPCGEDFDHYKWTGRGWPCPVCVAIRTVKEKEQEHERTCQRIATLVVEKLKISKT